MKNFTILLSMLILGLILTINPAVADNPANEACTGLAQTQLGTDIDGEAAGDQPGYSVSKRSANFAESHACCDLDQ